MPSIHTSEGAIFYARRGAHGPALVCLHGAGGNHQHWGHQLGALAGIAQVYVPDLPGHGRSARPGRTTIAAYAAAVIALLEACGLPRVVLAGHSMGSAIALELALGYPERVSALALVGGGARLRVAPAFLSGIVHDTAATVRTIVSHSYAPTAPADMLARAEAGLLQCDPPVYQGDLIACDAFDVRTRLGALRCPATIICGDADQMVPLKYSLTLHEQIAGSTLVVVAGVGHMPTIERPAEVSAALRALVQRAAAQGEAPGQ